VVAVVEEVEGEEGEEVEGADGDVVADEDEVVAEVGVLSK